MTRLLPVVALSQLLTLVALVAVSVRYDVLADVTRFIEAKSHRPELEAPSPHYRPTLDLFELYGEADGTVIAGDSHVALVSWTELIPELPIVARGIRGDTTRGLLDRIDRLLGHSQVVLMIGSNDVLRDEPARGIAERIVQTAARLRSSQRPPSVFVVSIPPVAASVRASDRMNRTVSAVNLRLRAAAQRGAFQFIDLHRHVTDGGGALAPSHTTDGVHLSAAAYRILRDAVRSSLAPGPRTETLAATIRTGSERAPKIDRGLGSARCARGSEICLRRADSATFGHREPRPRGEPPHRRDRTARLDGG